MALRMSAALSFRSLTSEINELLAAALLQTEKAPGPAVGSNPDASHQ